MPFVQSLSRLTGWLAVVACAGTLLGCTDDEPPPPLALSTGAARLTISLEPFGFDPQQDPPDTDWTPGAEDHRSELVGAP